MNEQTNVADVNSMHTRQNENTQRQCWVSRADALQSQHAHAHVYVRCGVYRDFAVELAIEIGQKKKYIYTKLTFSSLRLCFVFPMNQIFATPLTVFNIILKFLQPAFCRI